MGLEPTTAWTTTEIAAIRAPNVCLRSWNLISRTPARLRAAFNRFSSRERSIGLPLCG
jgi:hypothetical protein